MIAFFRVSLISAAALDMISMTPLRDQLPRCHSPRCLIPPHYWKRNGRLQCCRTYCPSLKQSWKRWQVPLPKRMRLHSQLYFRSQKKPLFPPHPATDTKRCLSRWNCRKSFRCWSRWKDTTKSFRCLTTKSYWSFQKSYWSFIGTFNDDFFILANTARALHARLPDRDVSVTVSLDRKPAI